MALDFPWVNDIAASFGFLLTYSVCTKYLGVSWECEVTPLTRQHYHCLTVCQ